MPQEGDIEEFHALGIRHILSLQRMPWKLRQKAKSLGLSIYSFQLRSNLSNIENIIQVLEEASPGSVLIHCVHGSDRSGLVAAYWLTTRSGYEPFQALAAMVSPSKYQVEGLREIAEKHYFTLHTGEAVGRFSGAKNGGKEGLKTRGKVYEKFIYNFLKKTSAQENFQTLLCESPVRS